MLPPLALETVESVEFTAMHRFVAHSTSSTVTTSWLKRTLRYFIHGVSRTIDITDRPPTVLDSDSEFRSGELRKNEEMISSVLFVGAACMSSVSRR